MQAAHMFERSSTAGAGHVLGALVHTLSCTWLALLLLASQPAFAEIAGKRPVVEDGDTLILAGARIDLHGLDAPELDQVCRGAEGAWACGQEARHALIHRVAFHWVHCITQGTSPDGTPSAICALGALGGPELNAWMVAQGWALAAPGGGRYAREQTDARAKRRGLWAGQFLAPWDWRQGRRLPGY